MTTDYSGQFGGVERASSENPIALCALVISHVSFRNEGSDGLLALLSDLREPDSMPPF